MSYTNGISNAQQLLNTTEAASTNRTAKTEQGSLSAATSKPVGSSGLGAVDQADLSTVGGVMAQALSGSDVRTEKVAALQQSISAGTYSVPASDVADKIISALLQ